MSSTNRVGGPGPSEPGKPQSSEKTQTGQHRKVEKVEKIKEISEIDEETKRRKFEQAMEEADMPEDERTPGPLEKDFYSAHPKKPSSSARDKSLAASEVIPSPSYSPPPPTLSGKGKESDDKGLPRSSLVWEKMDEPPDLPVPAKVFEETPDLSKGGVSLPLSHPIAPEKKKSSEDALIPSLGSGPLSPPSNISSVKSSKSTISNKAPHEPIERDEERDSRKRSRSRFNVTPSQLPPLPSHIVPAAIAATNQVISMLNSDTFALFYQMVGSIYMLAEKSGISTTEILLNSPAFSDSKFFGATITIEKYATAPDSLNIRLSGSDDAVTTFNQNLPNLLNAFQSGNFSFRIGRIDAVYQTEKPLFHRKSPVEERSGEHDRRDKERK